MDKEEKRIQERIMLAMEELNENLAELTQVIKDANQGIITINQIYKSTEEDT